MDPVVNIVNLQKKISTDRTLFLKIKKVIRQALVSEKCKRKGEFSVCLSDSQLIKRLNRKYFGRNYSTDVIVFNTGDIAVSTDAAFINATTFKTTPLYELLFYIAHGMLHILGYDDKTLNQRKLMAQKAAQILKKAGISNTGQ